MAVESSPWPFPITDDLRHGRGNAPGVCMTVGAIGIHRTMLIIITVLIPFRLKQRLHNHRHRCADFRQMIPLIDDFRRSEQCLRHQCGRYFSTFHVEPISKILRHIFRAEGRFVGIAQNWLEAVVARQHHESVSPNINYIETNRVGLRFSKFIRVCTIGNGDTFR